RRRLLTDADLAAPSDPLAAPGAMGKLNRITEKSLSSLDQFVSAVRVQNQLVMALIGCTLILMVSSMIMWILAPKATAELVTGIQEPYRSADGDKVFSLADHNDCEFRAGPKSMRMHYRSYKGSIGDTIAIALGAISEKQYVVTRIGDALKDPDGTILYKQNAPELSIIDHVETVNNQANQIYLKEGSYPNEFSEEAEKIMTYNNPFTGGRARPLLDHLEIGSKDASAEQADYARHHLYLEMQYGQGWKGKKNGGPGSISCCAVKVLSPRGVINLFVAQPSDRYGHPFTGSQPQSYYFTALEDGKTEHRQLPQLPFNEQSSVRPQVTWLIEPTLGSNDMDFLKHGGAYFYGLNLFLLAFLYAVIRPKDVAKVLLIGLIGWSLGATLLFSMANQLP
ncbi:MAG TPA: hypothetical protein V6C72_16675, partial [Chroococcales cyanobacterium]